MKRPALCMAVASGLTLVLAIFTVMNPSASQLQAAHTSGSPGVLLDIPGPPSMTGWRETPIRESAEPLVSLRGIHNRVVSDPNCSHPYLRKGAADRLASAAQALPSGYRLLVLDAHRSMADQKALFESARTRLSAQYPEKGDREILEMTERFVVPPSADPRTPPPHTTGGAVDVSIVGADGPLDMGPDGHRAEAATGFFGGRIRQSNVHENRRLLYSIMIGAGFTNYPQEWWHYDYGNQFWGQLSKRDAIYGLVER